MLHFYFYEIGKSAWSHTLDPLSVFHCHSRATSIILKNASDLLILFSLKEWNEFNRKAKSTKNHVC